MLKWMSYLSFKQQFLLIFVAFLLLISFIMIHLNKARWDNYSFSDKELKGYTLLQGMYDEMKTNALNNKLDIPLTSEKLKSLKLEKSSKIYTKDAIELISLIADETNLTLDPDIDSYYFMDLATNKWVSIFITLNSVNQHFDSIEKTISNLKNAEDQLNVIAKSLHKIKNYSSHYNLDSSFNAVATLRAYILSLEGQVQSQSINQIELEKAIYFSHAQMNQSLWHMQKAITKRVDNLRFTIMLENGITFVIMSLCAILFFAIYKSTIRSIQALNQFAQKINDNDLTATVDIQGRDEIAQVSQSFVTMVYHLKELISAINNKADITVEHTSQINSISHQVKEGTFSQTDATQSVAAAVEEIATSIAIIKDNTEKLEDETNETNKLAQANEKELNDVITEVEQLKVGIGSTVEYVAKLQKEVESIKGIIDLINGVAYQTNLLALNAAIEAARAGEAGRGFAVVADEVRKLSEQTQLATSDISKVINEINNEVEHTVQAIKEENIQVNHSVESIRHAITQTKEIASHFDAVFVKVQEIKYGIDEQNIAMHDIANKIEHISQSAESNLSQVDRNEELTTSLSNEVSELSQLTHKFKTN